MKSLSGSIFHLIIVRYEKGFFKILRSNAVITIQTRKWQKTQERQPRTGKDI